MYVCSCVLIIITLFMFVTVCEFTPFDDCLEIAMYVIVIMLVGNWLRLHALPAIMRIFG